MFFLSFSSAWRHVPANAVHVGVQAHQARASCRHIQFQVLVLVLRIDPVVRIG